MKIRQAKPGLVRVAVFGGEWGEQVIEETQGLYRHCLAKTFEDFKAAVLAHVEAFSHVYFWGDGDEITGFGSIAELLCQAAEQDDKNPGFYALSMPEDRVIREEWREVQRYRRCQTEVESGG